MKVTATFTKTEQVNEDRWVNHTEVVHFDNNYNLAMVYEKIAEKMTGKKLDKEFDIHVELHFNFNKEN